MVWRNVTWRDVTIFVFAQWRDMTKKIVFLLWRDVWRDDLSRGVTLFLGVKSTWTLLKSIPCISSKLTSYQLQPKSGRGPKGLWLPSLLEIWDDAPKKAFWPRSVWRPSPLCQIVWRPSLTAFTWRTCSFDLLHDPLYVEWTCKASLHLFIFFVSSSRWRNWQIATPLNSSSYK